MFVRCLLAPRPVTIRSVELKEREVEAVSRPSLKCGRRSVKQVEKFRRWGNRHSTHKEQMTIACQSRAQEVLVHSQQPSSGLSLDLVGSGVEVLCAYLPFLVIFFVR